MDIPVKDLGYETSDEYFLSIADSVLQIRYLRGGKKFFSARRFLSDKINPLPHNAAFDTLKINKGGKHCEKRRNCLLQAVSPFYMPAEDGTYYVVTRGGRAASPILCPEHISKTMLATVMKIHGWIDLIKAQCSAQEP